MEQLTISQFRDICKKHWPDFMSVEFICPHCKTVQTGNDLVKAGAGKDLDEIEGYLGFSCIGRFDNTKGCKWTLGGLFQIHELEVIGGPESPSVRRCFALNLPKAERKEKA